MENLAQSILDISSHIIAQNNWGIPDTYKAMIGLLDTHDIISEELSENLKNLVSMRNILVHRYADPDYGILWNSLKQISLDARSFVSLMREYLEKN
ncbi:MAG: type VII toxin-antitoxin system HepT family RNase toxin [Promethearchaeati archaeon]